jgi:hypothetical protein
VLRGLQERRALRAERRRADQELLAMRLPSPRLAWRTAELVSPDHRVALGRSVAEVVHAADERLLPTASPLDRGAVRACRSELLELASRLFDLERPVRPRGVLYVERLLDRGPLYQPTSGVRLHTEIERCLGEL